jgi:Pyocin activator protein PrtN
MNTLFLLIARYNALPVIPVKDVCDDYFQHLSPEKFLQKVLRGEISLPIVRIESDSQKTTKGVPIGDLAEYLDKQIAAARKECEQLRPSA